MSRFTNTTAAMSVASFCYKKITMHSNLVNFIVSKTSLENNTTQKLVWKIASLVAPNPYAVFHALNLVHSSCGWDFQVSF